LEAGLKGTTRVTHGSGDLCGLAARARVGNLPPARNPCLRARVCGQAWIFFSLNFTSAAAAVREPGTLTVTNHCYRGPDASSVGLSVSIFVLSTSRVSDSFVKHPTSTLWHLQDLQVIAKPIQMDGHRPNHSAKSAIRQLSAISSRKSPYQQLNYPTALSRPESSGPLESQLTSCQTHHQARIIQATQCLWSSLDFSNHKSPSSHHWGQSPPLSGLPSSLKALNFSSPEIKAMFNDSNWVVCHVPSKKGMYHSLFSSCMN
jgi:hypothetical protein